MIYLQSHSLTSIRLLRCIKTRRERNRINFFENGSLTQFFLVSFSLFLSPRIYIYTDRTDMYGINMHIYEENPCMYIYLCSNALDTDFQMVSIYVAQRFLAELLQFIEDIKGIKKKSKKWQDKQSEKELATGWTRKRCHENFILAYKIHAASTVSPSI